MPINVHRYHPLRQTQGGGNSQYKKASCLALRKVLYGFAAYHARNICDSKPIHIFLYVILKSYASPPPLIFT